MLRLGSKLCLLVIVIYTFDTVINALLLFDVCLDEETAEQVEERDEIDDLKMEEIATVTSWQNCYDAMPNDDNELH